MGGSINLFSFMRRMPANDSDTLAFTQEASPPAANRGVVLPVTATGTAQSGESAYLGEKAPYALAGTVSVDQGNYRVDLTAGVGMSGQGGTTQDKFVMAGYKRVF